MTHVSVDQATGERLLALLEQATKGEQVVLRYGVSNRPTITLAEADVW